MSCGMASIVVPVDDINFLDVFVHGTHDFGMCIEMTRFEQPYDTRGTLQRWIAVPAACDAALRDREDRALSRSTWPLHGARRMLSNQAKRRWRSRAVKESAASLAWLQRLMSRSSPCLDVGQASHR